MKVWKEVECVQHEQIAPSLLLSVHFLNPCSSACLLDQQMTGSRCCTRSQVSFLQTACVLHEKWLLSPLFPAEVLPHSHMITSFRVVCGAILRYCAGAECRSHVLLTSFLLQQSLNWRKNGEHSRTRRQTMSPVRNLASPSLMRHQLRRNESAILI